MNIHGAYITTVGKVRAGVRDVEVTGEFEFLLSDDGRDLAFFIEDENRARMEAAAAAINGDRAEIRRLLYIADDDAMRADERAESEATA